MRKDPTYKQRTVDEYLKFEEQSSARHEYVDGDVFLMTGSTKAHNLICANLLRKLDGHLAGTGCNVFLIDIKVHVKAANSFYYPDLLVTCEPFVPEAILTEQPKLIVEVLSPSTKHIDRREKLVNYRKLQSLREYLLVHQSNALVELHRREPDGSWSYFKLGKFEELVLESLPNGPLIVPVQEIYGALDLPSLVKEIEEDYDFSGN